MPLRDLFSDGPSRQAVNTTDEFDLLDLDLYDV